jgi:hypothetical protein
MHDIALPSAGDWAEFKKWCNAQGITANLKNKQIDGSKTWWPCIIELIIRDHSDANILLIKLRHLY